MHFCIASVMSLHKTVQRYDVAFTLILCREVGGEWVADYAG